MKFVELTPDEYHQYINHHFKQYTQSIEHYQARKEKGLHVSLLGVKDDNDNIVAAGLFTAAPLLKYFNYVYSHRGPMLDYSNTTLVEFYFNELKKYFKKRRTIFMLIDPYVIRHIRDFKGNIVEDFNISSLIETFNTLQYQHQGFSTGYSELSQARWLAILDLKDKAPSSILKGMEYNTAHSIKKAMQMGVKVKTLSVNEMDAFYALYQKAEIKHGFSLFTKSYLEQFVRNYPEITSIQLAYIHLNEHIDILKTKAHDIDEQIKKQLQNQTQPLSKKKQNKLKEQQIIYDKLQENMTVANQLRSKHGNTLHLAAAIFAETKDEMVYLFSGSDPEFNKFMGSYVLQWHMIQHAKQQHIDRYNFYGITGDFSPIAEDYGVLQFKKGFGGYIEELVGDFICVTHPLLYRIYQLKNK
ncbi:aminoacyltransferase [Staphylococcus agnetis]|uniref:aminoacyltransferase n=1 Tax=Staphylococcus agnetis TaxID=985762 RepID=UPI000CD1FA53|nr:aminoacyltransferase [Staphylococcus agnetis]MBY7664016.1 aminoacyltransferase [Staphylococcus agnetis]NJH68346.1 peptidoglycan bridge formation glycyltransferase FemA/FemB family protein [Staphylococcus agnetis]NJH78925.1 peptidoglycan bridge formation glycyltransferase FemA/FemB family protein [Staphylococcus agnetis]PNY87776.1 aminoacyltransferase [Staphylococcus agnetis]PTH66925.1 aminoacyltransferase [Staphylococcus agnetis]